MSAPDYKFKKEVLDSGLVQRYKDISKAKYAEYAKYRDGLLVPCKYDDISGALNDELLFSSICPEKWAEAERIAKADWERTKRLKCRIRSMLKSELGCVFATLTFTDETLANTSAETRRRYVQRYLKSQAQGHKYVANIDFGKENHREHYHAVVEGRLDPLSWSYGALNVKRVRKTSNPAALAKYVAKLSNHAIKETCKRSVLIYSREFAAMKTVPLTPEEELAIRLGFRDYSGPTPFDELVILSE